MDSVTVRQREQAQPRRLMTRATLAPDKGDIEFELFTDSAPEGPRHFTDLARRVLRTTSFPPCHSRFLIQGGDGQYGKKSKLDTNAWDGGPGYKFRRRAGQRRSTPGAPWRWPTAANTNGSQFFICHRPGRQAAEDYTLWRCVLP